MIPTYVFGWPTGKERGSYLAVDLGKIFRIVFAGRAADLSAGGTNLRVCLVTLQGEGKFEITQSKYRLTEEQKQEDGQKLFDFCGECLKSFVDSSIESGTIEKGTLLPLGFTVRIYLSLFRLHSTHWLSSSHTHARALVTP